LTKKYIYGPGIDNPIVMINVSGTTETWYYYYTDALGSVRLITDDEGTIVEGYTYGPFGRAFVMYGINGAGTDGNWLTEDTTSILPYSPLGNPYMFTARRWDYNANLYYYRFRDYQPDLGRFCQPDPLGYIDGMNLYAYCGNNPLNWIDPWGLDAKAMMEEKLKMLDLLREYHKDPSNPLCDWRYNQCFEHAKTNYDFLNSFDWKYWKMHVTMASWNRGWITIIPYYSFPQINHTVLLVEPRDEYRDLGFKPFIFDTWLKWRDVRMEWYDDWKERWHFDPDELIWDDD
jgi:RHS repeat-associated protein